MKQVIGLIQYLKIVLMSMTAHELSRVFQFTRVEVAECMLHVGAETTARLVDVSEILLLQLAPA